MSAISEKLEVLLHDAVECTDVLVSSVDTEFQIPILEWISDDKLSFHHVILEFFQNHLLQNTPCILSETATSNWKSRRKWVTDDLKPDFEYLKTHFGEANVPVADCHSREYNSQKKESMALFEFLMYWQELINDGYDYGKHRLLYLKDWHFMREFPFYKAYEVLECFSSDWLNEFWCQRTDVHDDYRFVYMGPKGSWTPLHTDVFHSYSWSGNVCGVKKWILFPPEEEENLKDRTGQLAYDVSAPIMEDRDIFPHYHKVLHRYEVEQKPGQIIFVPSRWLHQVLNLDDTISINHNWFNGFNIDIIWKSLIRMNNAVEKEIDHCRSMDGWNMQCQLILKATHGMDFKEFYALLRTVADQRLSNLKKHENTEVFDTWKKINNVFDLYKTYRILLMMLSEHSVKNCVEISLEYLNSIHASIQKFSSHSMYTFPPATTCC